MTAAELHINEVFNVSINSTFFYNDIDVITSVSLQYIARCNFKECYMKKKVREKLSHSTKLSSKRTGNGKKIIAFCIVFFISIVCAYADSGRSIGKLDDYARLILGIFTSFWMKALCAVAFIIICIRAITVGRDEPGLIKKYIPWGVGVLLLLSAGQIVNFFFNGNENIADQLGCLVQAVSLLVA
jgi:hypothetical protein